MTCHMTQNSPEQSSSRLLSLDFFRGLTMFLLIAEGTGLWWTLVQDPIRGTILEHFFIQFEHHPWHGLRFWDLIQPFFMFIVGVAMPFSYRSRIAKGESSRTITRHIIQRSIILLAFGVGLHCGYNKRLVWELWNVLSQLSVTILIAYFLMKYPIKVQLVVSLLLLLFSDLAYRWFPLEGYNQPWVIDKNFGSWMDMLLMGKLNKGGGWVTINCISTAAHTIWGVMAGQLFLKDVSQKCKFKTLLIAGGIALFIGFSLDLTGITPIIKRIATSSFVFVSGGWALIGLVLSYWLIDIKGFKNWIFIFTVVGTNSIFIYVFFQTVGSQWMNDFIAIFSKGMLSWTGVSEFVLNLFTSLVILASEWGLCYWLFRHKIFFRI
jgi:predicted acyltransferase